MIFLSMNQKTKQGDYFKNTYLIISLIAVLLASVYYFIFKKNKAKKISDNSKFVIDFNRVFQNLPYYNLKTATKFISTTEFLYHEQILKDLAHKIPHQSIIRLNKLEGYDNLRKFVLKKEYLKELLLQYNMNFIAYELHTNKTFFDKTLKYPLDPQQRHAIISDEDNTLVTAGAGSGKSTTIEGKIAYILNKKQANPDEILVLSYSKDSADDLTKKLSSFKVDVKTFHSFAYHVIKDCDRNPEIIETQKSKELIQKFYKEVLQDKSWFRKISTFLTDNLQPLKTQFDFKSQNDYNDYTKLLNLKTLKAYYDRYAQKENKQSPSDNLSVNRDYVKSKEELQIANFLFLNGIAYEYEAPFLYNNQLKDNSSKKKYYKPDFTIYINGKKDKDPKNILYLEHYGLNKDGKTAPFVDCDNYLEEKKWKDELHKSFETNYICTYSYQFNQSNNMKQLIEQLKAYGVKLHPKSDKEIVELYQKCMKYEVDELSKLISTFINLYKSNDYNFENLRRKINKESKSDNIRNRQLLEIIECVYIKYEQYLKDNLLFDFSSIITKAIEYVESNQFIHKYKYVIIDEFQDISLLRSKLILALKKQNYLKVFAVGDDWQSIYRFTGCDLSIFNDFETYFGATYKTKIENTYRFNQPLIDISSHFIQQNRNQLKKNLKGVRKNETSLDFIAYSNFGYSDFEKKFRDIFKYLYAFYKDLLQYKKILVLGRYNSDMRQISTFKTNGNDKENYTKHYINIENTNVMFNFYTVHKSKGLEADIVIILNCNSGRNGFPSQISDDPLLSFVLKNSDNFPNSEERRLFYVAMTRAKEKLFLMHSQEFPSKFIRELKRVKLEDKRKSDRYIFKNKIN